MKIVYKKTIIILALSAPGMVTNIYSQDKQQTAKKTKPNIVLVLTDDQGKNDLHCEGNPYVKSPNIDKFYNDAVRFTNFHVSTTSSPSRSAIMTGRYTDRLNCYHTIAGRSMVYSDETFLSEVLAQHGYATGMFGKWHLGDNYPFRPMDRGFQRVVRHGDGAITGTPDYWGNDYFDDTYWTDGVPVKYKGYCTDVWFREAEKFIKKNADSGRPFFCYLSLNAVHGPHNVPVKYYHMYNKLNKDIVPERNQRMYGMVTNIDDNFKILQDDLKKWGLKNNTIFIFMTDNGTSGGELTYDAGLRGHKGSEYEGGHRVPFYIQWPAGNIGGENTTTAGKDINTLVAHYDLFPTLIDLLDINYHPKKPMDGKSWLPLIKTLQCGIEDIPNKGSSKVAETAQWEDRALFVDTQRIMDMSKYRRYSIMTQQWRYTNGHLYDMRNDLAQTTDVSKSHPYVVKYLKEAYERWWASFINEGVDQRYARIICGTKYENPVRLTCHDLHTANLGHAWSQEGIREAQPGIHGCWKIRIAETGKYKISLRHFPRSSGYGINDHVPAQKPDERFETTYSASTKDDFVTAFLCIGPVKKRIKISDGVKEISITTDISEGNYDLWAELIDSQDRCYPAYFVYVEKL